LFVKDPKMQVNIESDANVKYINQDVTTQNETTKEEEFEQPQPQPSLSDSENPSVAIDWVQR
jgi:hypothetical protein